MPHPSNRPFRPSFDLAEFRVLATAGITPHPGLVHHAMTLKTSNESHQTVEVKPVSHATPKAATHKATTGTVTTTSVSTASTPKAAPVVVPPAAPVVQSWVKLVNMTGQPLDYQISLSPYKNGQFLPFEIDGQATEYQMTSQVVDDRYVPAKVQIEFGNGQVTTLNTGPSQATAQGYYLFLDSNLQYIVVPFISSPGPY